MAKQQPLLVQLGIRSKHQEEVRSLVVLDQTLLYYMTLFIVIDMVPLYRYWKNSKSDHFYTTNIDEIGTATPGAMGRFDYKSEGIQCLIYSKLMTGTVATGLEGM